ncbi:virginiamycin B lyase family protein [Myxococcus stipitatus]|uniref:Vgb family protein n=1 Tax=Myxococcus stipitatus TaxID=83455 RepID=UPI0030CCFD1A
MHLKKRFVPRSTLFAVCVSLLGAPALAADTQALPWVCRDSRGTLGSIDELALPTGAGPVSITLGPDLALWFTEQAANEVGSISTEGVIREFDLPVDRGGPSAIVAGLDGNVWFTEQTGNRISRITPEGVVTQFAVPTEGSQPNAIAVGPDGQLWFTARGTHKLGKIRALSVP